MATRGDKNNSFVNCLVYSEYWLNDVILVIVIQVGQVVVEVVFKLYGIFLGNILSCGMTTLDNYHVLLKSFLKCLISGLILYQSCT